MILMYFFILELIDEVLLLIYLINYHAINIMNIETFFICICFSLLIEIN